jgi:hypothetical protein
MVIILWTIAHSFKDYNKKNKDYMKVKINKQKQCSLDLSSILSHSAFVMEYQQTKILKGISKNI